MVALLLLGPLGCAPKGQHLPTVTLQVNGTAVTAEIADTPAERELGLMYRDALPADHGMLFVYPEEQLRAFWMKNTKIPLSIAFLSASGRVVSTSEMAAFDETPVPSEFPAMYALEMSRGWFVAHAVTAGAAVLGLPPASGE